MVSLTTAQSTLTEENGMQAMLNRITYLEQWHFSQKELENRIVLLEEENKQMRGILYF